MNSGDSAITIAAEVQQETQQARQTYRELLTLPNPNDGQKASLRDAIRLLGKKPPDVVADLAAIRRVAELREKIAHAHSDEVKQQEEKARIAQKEFAEETRLLIEQRNKEYAKLVMAVRDAQAVIGRADSLANELRSLEHQHADLLGIRQLPLPKGNDGHLLRQSGALS